MQIRSLAPWLSLVAVVALAEPRTEPAPAPAEKKPEAPVLAPASPGVPPAAASEAVGPTHRPEMEKRLREVDGEISDLTKEEKELREKMREHYQILSGLSTALGTQDVQVVKMQGEIKTLETKLQDLRDQLRKKTEEMPAFKDAKAAADKLQARAKEVREKKMALLREKAQISGGIYRMNRAEQGPMQDPRTLPRLGEKWPPAQPQLTPAPAPAQPEKKEAPPQGE